MENSGPAMDMLVTDLHPPQPAQVIKVEPVKYISMDDWMQDQIERDALQAQESRKESGPPPTKKQKNSIPSLGPEMFAVEEEARKALGDENWVGLLQRYCDVNPQHKVKHEEHTISQPLPRFQCITTLKGISEEFGAGDPQTESHLVSFSNKKIAKQYASKKAVDWLIANKYMPGDGNVTFAIPTLLPSELVSEQEALKTLADENWVNLLNQYCQANGKRIPKYEETSVGSKPTRFQCTITIEGLPTSFGCTNSTDQELLTFSSKRPSKQYAAKQAVDWLIANNHMPADGTIKFPKVPQVLQRTATPTATISTSPNLQGTPYTAQVPDLCYRLNIPAPSYVLKPAAAVPNCPLWDGYADFAGHPRFGDEGKVGNVANVVGKKNAKEALAKQVFVFLKGIEANRLKQYEEEDKKRKRSPASSQTEVSSASAVGVQA
ncbi:uncharacterized protein LY89DRAFT_715327 [Mollisia scopiformis]|uniref:DRBM domain-containing protein n=1 Tax=Mollisia scopiformis TaxID=149040 RepID=A0A194XLS9_MOLSC|nr:uncharacterized protein LY89DRAFT_715327 [Mollisia scopiformis]KUJ21039.1 hypothetical protein LY89DRAFT_715327 [Mollisia scopiformis]